MEKFKDVVTKLTENASPQLKILIQQHLTNFTSTFHTPDHPPYAAMIHRAIEELNEKNGSSEESISSYIKDQHTDLPLAHSSLLKHHLGRLCDSGEIVVTGKQLYLLPGSNNPTLESSVRTEKDRLTRKRKARKGRGRGRVGKKYLMETDKHGETHGEVHAKTDRRNKKNDEIIGDNNGVKINNKVDRVGELDLVVKQTEQENVMLDDESQLHQQLAHAICAPVVDSKQPNLTSPDRPPGFEFINFQSKQKDLKEPEMIINSGRLFESETETLPQTLPQVDQEQSRQGQLNCNYQLLSECSKSAYVSTEYLPSQNQQQQLNPSNLEGLQGVEYLKLLEPHQKFKQYRRRKKLTKEKEMQDVSVELEKKAKQLDLSELDKSSQSFSAGSRQQLEFCKEKQLQESVCCEQKQRTSTCYDEQHIVEQHDKSVSNNTIEQQGTKKVGHGVRRSQRLAKSAQICTLSLDLLPSSPSSQYHHIGHPEVENDPSSIQGEEPSQPKMESDYVNLAQKLQQLQLPAGDSAHTTQQTEMVKTTIVLQQRAKLCSWQKLCISHENKPSGSSMALGRTEQVQQEPLIGRTEQVQQEPLCLEYHQKPVDFKELSMQQQVQQEPLCLEYYHQKPVDFKELSMQQQAHETELEARTSTMEMSPSHQRQPQMHLGRGRGRCRPPKMKLGQRLMQNP